ncbi:hypothetical protein EV283_3380 [Sphingomonas sp. BK036]|nr:hypothetical protein EV283_3380 [Sphingomonas sp. BK036]
MLIRPEHCWLYPIDWRELSQLVRFRRAKRRCDHCHRPHGKVVVHLGDGRWWDPNRSIWRDGRGRRVRLPGDNIIASIRSTRVVLACAHLDHDPTNSAQYNLAALCQRCHRVHDATEHRRRRWSNAFRRRARGDLFAGDYPRGGGGQPARTRGTSESWVV